MDRAHTSTQSGCITAFVAEDSAGIRERLKDLLEETGAIRIVGEAVSAIDAIEGILALRPDVVTLDIHLHDGSGLKVIREVRKLAPEVHFVVLTNHPDPFYRRAFAREGASCFLDKSREFGRVREEVLAACEETGELTKNADSHH